MVIDPIPGSQKGADMDTLFRLKHYTNRVLLTFLGPADLEDHADPRVQLRREYDERMGRPLPSSGQTAQLAPATKAIA